MGVGAVLGPRSGHNVLDCSTAWLADREQWLAAGMGSRPTRGESSLPEQRICSYNLSCHLGQGEDQLVWEGGRGPGTLRGPPQSLPTLCLSFPIPPPIAIT